MCTFSETLAQPFLNYKWLLQKKNITFFDKGTDLLSQISFYYKANLLNSSLIENPIIGNPEYFDFPYEYRANAFLQNMQKVSSFFFLGFNPRFDFPLLNLYFKKNLKTKNSTFWLNTFWNENTYPTKILGTTNKFFWQMSFGYEKILKYFLKEKNFCFFSNNYKKIILEKTSLPFESMRFSKFMHLFGNSQNMFFLLNNENSSLNFFESGLFKKKNKFNFLKKNIYNKATIFQANFLFANDNKKIYPFLSKKSVIFFFTTHKYNAVIKENNNHIFMLPVPTIFEKNSFNYNVEGNLKKINKTLSIFSNAVKQEIDLFEVISSLALEKKKKYNKNFYLILNVLNFLQRNIEEYFFSFFLFFFEKKNYNKKAFFFSWTALNKNFYQTDLISSYSTTLAYLALLNNKKSLLPFKK